MPITFGSVGDIIAVCLLIKDLVKTLDDSRGSSAEYQEIIRELWILERALLEVEMLSRTCDNTVELNALCATARRASDECRKSIEVFLEKIRGYDEALRNGGSGNAFRDVSKKIKWQISQKDDLTRFRAEINAHSTSINMLLMTASVGLIKMNNERLNARMTKKETKDQQASIEQTKLLHEINDRLQSKDLTMSSQDAAAVSTLESQRWRWLTQLCTELRNLMQKIFRLNVKTYTSVLRIESIITSHLEKTLLQEPFILEDAIGRLAPVHMQFITSWQAFDAVLELRFQNFPGERKIKRKEFVLQDHATTREIDRSYPWEGSFVPGQMVDMSMLFVNRETATTSCPKCSMPSTGSSQSDNQCVNCGMWYRRITEYVDADSEKRPERIPGTSPVEFENTEFGESSTASERPDEIGDLSGSDEVDRVQAEADLISHFKRVRLISQEDRMRPAPIVSSALPKLQTQSPTYSLTDFVVMQAIGAGDVSASFLAQSKHNQRYYTLKVYEKAKIVRQRMVERVNDERAVLRECKHPFIIHLWAAFQDPSNLYMVMDFAHGGELFTLLRKAQRFPNPVAKFYAAETTLALDYLHSQGIIYRNLDPSNILLTKSGHIKLANFGLAIKCPDVTWTLCGNPEYLAPEVVASKGYNKASDWWSLGVLIFEMCCGFTPFGGGGSQMKIYENILNGEVKYPPYIHPDAEDLLQHLITPDLSRRLGNRRGGAQEVMDHRWFAEVTWIRLLKRDIDAPWSPQLEGGEGDTSQYDKYAGVSIRSEGVGKDSFSNIFADF